MVKQLMKSIREYALPSILSPVFVALEVILECFIPFLMSKLIDSIYSGTIEKVLLLGLTLILMAFMALIFGVLSGKFCATASAGFAKNLREDLYAKVQDFSFTNIDKFSSSSLVTRLTSDVTNVQDAYMMMIRIVVRAPFMLIFSFIMSFTISVKISLIFLAIVPFLALGLFFIFAAVSPIFKKVFDKYDDLNASVQENVKGMRVVKSYVREEFEINKFNKAANELKNDFTRAEKIIALNNPLMQFSMYIVILLVAGFGSFIIIDTFQGVDINGDYIWGELSTGNLSSLIAYAMQILSSLMILSMILVYLSMSKASIRRIIEVLKEEPTVVNPKNPISVLKNGDVVFNNVSFKYSETAAKNALSDINFSIKSGETVGIIGGTGSSKTTLIQLISRLYDATEGTVSVGGADVALYDLTALRNEVSVVLQNNILFSGTVEENLRWGKEDATEEEMIAACKLAQAHDFISVMKDGYQSHVEQGGNNFSGGQKQRLCIARAILKKPKILILDDSTSAVDTRTDMLIRNALNNSIPDTTKIIIAQRTTSIMGADKIFVMDDGTIVNIGTHDELLLSSQIYQEVYSSQNKVGE